MELRPPHTKAAGSKDLHTLEEVYMLEPYYVNKVMAAGGSIWRGGGGYKATRTLDLSAWFVVSLSEPA